MAMSLARTSLLTIAVAALACSSSSSGASGSVYPAFELDQAQLNVNRPPTIAAPKIVTVTWAGDPNAAALESFGDQLGKSEYWRSTVGEYGIGAATSGLHVRVSTPPPATMTRDDLQAWLVNEAGGAGWPPYDASTIYVIYVPTSIDLQPTEPYHSETVMGANAHVPFVVITEKADGSRSVMDTMTAAASHEIAETATNPRVLSMGADLGVVDFDKAKYLAWSLSTGDAEIGDLCEGKPESVVRGPAEFPVMLQRLWSNKAAAAGHDPCIPAPATPFYSVTPIDLETVDVFVDTEQTATRGRGFRIGVGQKKTIQLGFFSDAPMPGPWTITAAEGSYFSPAENHRLAISVVKGTGDNGDVGSIEVTANRDSLGAGSAVLLTVTSERAGLPSHSVPILIGTY